MKQVHFENPDVVRRYAQGPTAFVPAYEQMQRMTAQLIKEGPFDAASCLLTLHFVADDGSKLQTLLELKKRLKPGAPFVLVDCCIDISSPSAEFMLARYRDFALGSGADPEQVSTTCDRLVNVLKMVSPARNEALLKSAGFTDVELFYAGLSWRGWRATA